MHGLMEVESDGAKEWRSEALEHLWERENLCWTAERARV